MSSERIFRTLLCLIVALLGGGLCFWQPPVFERFALPLEDFKFAVRERLGAAPVGPPELVVVAVDETSINRYGRWPWGRGVMADLVEKLGEAKLVGFDMVFADPSSVAEDRVLAEAVSASENVVAGFFLRSQATQWTSLADLDQLAEWAFRDVQALDQSVGVKDYPFVETNLPEIGAGALAGGFFNGEPDLDGLYRRYPLAFLHQGYVLPSLTVQMARFALDREPRLVLDAQGINSFTLDRIDLRSNYLRLNFGQLDPGSFIPAADVLDGRLPSEFFRNKLVLVGVTEVGVFDLRPTPVDPVTPGIWIHYTALANFLSGNLLRESLSADLLLLISGLLLAWAIGRQRRLGLRIVLYLLGPLLLLVAANGCLLGTKIWTREFYALFSYLLLVVALEAHSFFYTERRAGELKRAFTSYVSPEVVREILDNPDKLDLGGVERNITILFSDIRGFTSLSEKVSAPQLVQMLNMIHDPLTQIVLAQRGMLDKYIGDAMMALFNTPVAVEDHPVRATQAALEMVAALQDINRLFADRHLPPVDMGIGINTGECVVGNMGSKVRFEYTAIGDAVNLASRLEGLCKVYHTHIIVSEFTREHLGEMFLLRLLDRVRVKGKTRPVAIYEVMAATNENQQLAETFEKVLADYFAGEFATARSGFQGIYECFNDETSRVFLERCAHFSECPPGLGWDGVFEMMNK